MATLQTTSEELSKMKKLGRGSCSTVYRYNNDLVIKELNEQGIKLHREEEFSQIVGIENNTCVFPQNRVEVDGTFKGYTMEYIKGKPLHEIIKKIDIQVLISAIQKVEGDLKQLSSKKILFQDLNEGGIMWDENEQGIKIIDTDFFLKSEGREDEECYNYNIKWFNSILEMEMGFLTGQSTKLSEYLMTNLEFSTLYANYTKKMIQPKSGQNISITELINKAVEITEKEFRTNINSIEDILKLIGERTETLKSTIPIFEPPQETNNNIGITKRVINFLAEKTLLRKIPFFERLISKKQKALPQTTTSKQRGTRASFLERIKGKPITPVQLPKSPREYPKEMADPNKIKQIEEK